MDTSQKGHWYKCKNVTCDLRIPLPDKIFIETHYNEAFEAKCKCGHINIFMYSDAQNETKKWEVDKYFDIKDPKGRPKFEAFWEGD